MNRYGEANFFKSRWKFIPGIDEEFLYHALKYFKVQIIRLTYPATVTFVSMLNMTELRQKFFYKNCEQIDWAVFSGHHRSLYYLVIQLTADLVIQVTADLVIQVTADLQAINYSFIA